MSTLHSQKNHSLSDQ